MSTPDPELHAERGPWAVAELAPRRAREQAWKQFAQAQTIEEYCRAWLALQCQIVGGVAEAVVALQKPGGDAFAPVAYYPGVPQGSLKLAEVTERALRE